MFLFILLYINKEKVSTLVPVFESIFKSLWCAIYSPFVSPCGVLYIVPVCESICKSLRCAIYSPCL